MGCSLLPHEKGALTNHLMQNMSIFSYQIIRLHSCEHTWTQLTSHTILAPLQARKVPLSTHPLAPRRTQPHLRPQNLQTAKHARTPRIQKDPPARQIPHRHHRLCVSRRRRQTPRAGRVQLRDRVPDRAFRGVVGAEEVEGRNGGESGRRDRGVVKVSVFHALR